MIPKRESVLNPLPEKSKILPQSLGGRLPSFVPAVRLFFHLRLRLGLISTAAPFPSGERGKRDVLQLASLQMLRSLQRAWTSVKLL